MQISFKKIFHPFNLLFYLMLIYFIYHLLFSARGIITYFDLKKQLSESEIEAAKVYKTRQSLEGELRVLDPNNLSNDMLEEQAKRSFSFGAPEEVLLINDEVPK